ALLGAWINAASPAAERLGAGAPRHARCSQDFGITTLAVAPSFASVWTPGQVHSARHAFQRTRKTLRTHSIPVYQCGYRCGSARLSPPPMNGSATWTPRRSLTVLLIALNFLAFVVWGVVFWNEFERVRSVAGWLAGAVAAVLAWIGIEQSRKHELGSVLDLPPTRLLVGAATVL